MSTFHGRDEDEEDKADLKRALDDTGYIAYEGQGQCPLG